MIEIREAVDCRSDMASEKFLMMKDIKRCVSSAYSICKTVEEFIR